MDEHRVRVPGCHGVAEAADDPVCFAIALRHLGNGWPASTVGISMPSALEAVLLYPARVPSAGSDGAT